MGYLGNVMMRESKFNPYLTAAVGQVNWELTESGRGPTSSSPGTAALEGNDLAVAFGIGHRVRAQQAASPWNSSGSGATS